jgi:alanyl-tRNA synthetase
VQQQERLLWKVSEVLSAPVEKLDKTAERRVKELKEASATIRKLEKKLVALEATTDARSSADLSSSVTLPVIEVTEFGGIKFYKINYHDDNDINRMIQTTTEKTKQPGSIALAYCATNKTATMILSGSLDVTQAGFDASKIIKATAPIFGGGGGGRPNFAQGGGTQPEKLQEAVEKAEETINKIRKQLQH